MFERIQNYLGKWYIYHEDLQTPDNGIAYFGPFRGWEIGKRVNDAYADLLAGSGNVDSLRLTRKLARSFVNVNYINPRKYWMKQLKEFSR